MILYQIHLLAILSLNAPIFKLLFAICHSDSISHINTALQKNILLINLKNKLMTWSNGVYVFRTFILLVHKKWRMELQFHHFLI